MQMCLIPLVFALFVLAVATEQTDSQQNDCVFVVNGQQYDFSLLRGTVFQYAAKDGSFNATYSLCGNLSKSNSGCNPSSGVCITQSRKTPTSFGNASMISFATEDPDALTMIVSGGDECAYGAKRRTTFHIMCSSSAAVIDAQLYSCSVAFSMYSPYACGIGEADGMYDGDWGKEPHTHFSPFFLFFAIALACMSICICACACCRRKRMIEARKKREAELIKMTNIAFQAVPQEEPKMQPVKPQPLQGPVRLPVPVPVQHMPAYYPPVQIQAPLLQPPQFQQPAQYFLYPAVQHPIQFQPATFANPQTNPQH